MNRIKSSLDRRSPSRRRRRRRRHALAEVHEVSLKI